MWSVPAGKMRHGFSVWPDRESDLVKPGHLADSDLERHVRIAPDHAGNIGNPFPEARQYRRLDRCAGQRGQRPLGGLCDGIERRPARPGTAHGTCRKIHRPAFFRPPPPALKHTRIADIPACLGIAVPDRQNGPYPRVRHWRKAFPGARPAQLPERCGQGAEIQPRSPHLAQNPQTVPHRSESEETDGNGLNGSAPATKCQLSLTRLGQQ